MIIKRWFGDYDGLNMEASVACIAENDGVRVTAHGLRWNTTLQHSEAQRWSDLTLAVAAINAAVDQQLEAR